MSAGAATKRPASVRAKRTKPATYEPCGYAIDVFGTPVDAYYRRVA